jgi:lipoyl(octanoyl) transferase
VIVRRLGLVAYEPTWRAMQEFTGARTGETADQVWLCQHPPVFTQGLAGRAEHLLRDIGIPVVKIDRGGQITYHGPGQLVAYLLLDLRRRGLTVKGLVNRLEQAVIDLLAGYGIAGERRQGAPGVYVGGAKVSALGLKIKNGCSYHGLSLNVAMDLTPFSAINPCGYEGLAVVQLAELCSETDIDRVGEKLAAHLERLL